MPRCHVPLSPIHVRNKKSASFWLVRAGFRFLQTFSYVLQPFLSTWNYTKPSQTSNSLGSSGLHLANTRLVFVEPHAEALSFETPAFQSHFGLFKHLGGQGKCENGGHLGCPQSPSLNKTNIKNEVIGQLVKYTHAHHLEKCCICSKRRMTCCIVHLIKNERICNPPRNFENNRKEIYVLIQKYQTCNIQTKTVQIM